MLPHQNIGFYCSVGKAFPQSSLFFFSRKISRINILIVLYFLCFHFLAPYPEGGWTQERSQMWEEEAHAVEWSISLRLT